MGPISTFPCHLERLGVTHTDNSNLMIGIQCIPPRHHFNLHDTDRALAHEGRNIYSVSSPFCLVFERRPKSRRVHAKRTTKNQANQDRLKTSFINHSLLVSYYYYSY